MVTEDLGTTQNIRKQFKSDSIRKWFGSKLGIVQRTIKEQFTEVIIEEVEKEFVEKKERRWK
jgi:hypothetical protein